MRRNSIQHLERVDRLAASRPQFGGHDCAAGMSAGTFAMVSKRLTMMKKTLPAWFLS